MKLDTKLIKPLKSSKAKRFRIPVPKGDLKRELDAMLYDSLPTLSLVMVFLFIVFAISHALLMSGSLALVMVSIALLTSLISLVLYLVLRRGVVPTSLAYPVAAVMAVLILVNALAHLYLTSDPLQTTNVIILVAGLGFLLLNTRWWVLIIVLTYLGWGSVVHFAEPASSWLHFGFALLSSTALSFLVHLARLRNVQRIAGLRLQSDQQQVALQQALRSAARTQLALETTIGVAQHMGSILELEPLLIQVAELIKERYGYYYVSIFMVDDSGEYLDLQAGTGEIGRQLCEKGIRFRISQEGIVGWAAGKRRAVRVNDVANDDRYLFLSDIPNTRSELALPLIVGPVLWGVLDIQSDEVGAFGDSDVQILHSLAALVARAIQNASLYQVERAQRLLAEKLYEVGQALSRTLELGEVLDLILKELAEIVPYDRGSVMLERGDKLSFFSVLGFPEELNPLNVSVPIKDGDVYIEIKKAQEPLLVPEVQARSDWEYVEDLPPARSWLGVPLIGPFGVIGMLSLTRERPEPYTEDEVTLASAFAGQAAVALENARLFDEARQANRKLELSVEQLQQQSEQLKIVNRQIGLLDRAKSDFITVASHELRTPLTVISGYSQILARDPFLKQKERYQPMVEGIRAGSDRLYKIVESMLDMAKIDNREFHLHMEPLSIGEVIDLVHRNLEDVIVQRRLEVEVGPFDDLPEVEADVEAIRKVFYNLITNAIKYTPDGGEIKIVGRSLEPEEFDFPEGGIEIKISDTGIGIDPVLHEMIFSKFYRYGEVELHSSSDVRFKGGGPGLGLAIARGIVEAHGGKIWVESPGYDEQALPGSDFYVVLPLTPKILLEATPSEA